MLFSLFPHSSFLIKCFPDNYKNILMFDRGASAFKFLVEFLSHKYNNIIFLIPAFTCPSILFSLQDTNVNFDFIDIGDDLDFDLEDLKKIIKKYDNSKIVIVATSLFGAENRNYKKLFPECILVKDLAQAEYRDISQADFQFYSFGKGKMISVWNGGVLQYKEYDQNLSNKYQELKTDRLFVYKFCLSFIQKIAIKFLWKKKIFLFLQNRIHVRQEIKPRKVGNIFRNWVLCSIKTFSREERLKNTKIYNKEINAEFKFNLRNNRPLLRFPVKFRHKDLCGFIDYRYTYKVATKKRGKTFEIPYKLLYESSFLPTHELMKERELKIITKLINESNIQKQ